MIIGKLAVFLVIFLICDLWLTKVITSATEFKSDTIPIVTVLFFSIFVAGSVVYFLWRAGLV